MTMHSASEFDLTGMLLIAMPGMDDPRFKHAVVFLCAHSSDGAMGLIVNKPAHDVVMRDVLSQLDIAASPHAAAQPIYFGGPVEMSRGFILHSDNDRSDPQTQHVCKGFALSTTLDMLATIAEGNGPEQALVLLGYAGWAAGQLEDEIAQNGWLTAPARHDLVFSPHNDVKWNAALDALGVGSLNLSTTAGHA